MGGKRHLQTCTEKEAKEHCENRLERQGKTEGENHTAEPNHVTQIVGPARKKANPRPSWTCGKKTPPLRGKKESLFTGKGESLPCLVLLKKQQPGNEVGSGRRLQPQGEKGIGLSGGSYRGRGMVCLQVGIAFNILKTNGEMEESAPFTGSDSFLVLFGMSFRGGRGLGNRGTTEQFCWRTNPTDIGAGVKGETGPPINAAVRLLSGAKKLEKTSLYSKDAKKWNERVKISPSLLSATEATGGNLGEGVRIRESAEKDSRAPPLQT